MANHAKLKPKVIPDMEHIKSIEHARTVFLDALGILGVGTDRQKAYIECEDLYQIRPKDWYTAVKIVTGISDTAQFKFTKKIWITFFRDIGWTKADKDNRLTIKRRVYGKSIGIIGVDKEMFRLLRDLGTRPTTDSTGVEPQLAKRGETE